MQHIKQSLDSLAAGFLRAMPEDERAVAGWRHVCGRKAAEHAQAVSFSGGRLKVSVDDPAWVATLEQLRGQYCAKLQALTGVQVNQIEFFKR